jgi:ubiquinone/menaquinone biosynthesis C-methylase UbiE
MSLSGWLFAAAYDRLTAATEAAGLAERRARLLAQASGRVLEVGAGTGANIPHYLPAASALTLAEPEAPMARKLRERVARAGRPIDVIEAPAERLPFPDASFDTVVSTLVLCTVRDLPKALAELRRVLTPGGRLLFLEHVRSDDPRVARWQDRLNGLNRIVAHGCNCNRPTLEGIRTAGFHVISLKHDEIPKAPAFVRPLIVGVAEPARN